MGQYILPFFAGHAGTPILNELMAIFAEYLVYLVPVALLYLWFVPEDGKSKSVFIFTTIVVSLAISYAMGQLYAHPAPYMAGYETVLADAPENSFPSQHTTVVFAFAWALASLQDRRRDGLVGLVFASLVGISRVYVGVHYPVDIVGGVVASLAGFALVSLASGVVMDFARRCIHIEDRLKTALLRVR